MSIFAWLLVVTAFAGLRFESESLISDLVSLKRSLGDTGLLFVVELLDESVGSRVRVEAEVFEIAASKREGLLEHCDAVARAHEVVESTTEVVREALSARREVAGIYQLRNYESSIRLEAATTKLDLPIGFARVAEKTQRCRPPTHYDNVRLILHLLLHFETLCRNLQLESLSLHCVQLRPLKFN